MSVCLPKEARDKLLKALKSGDVSLAKLIKMTDKERNALFERYVGENASFVNAKFEQAMLSKQKKGFSNWITQTTAFKDPLRRDMLKKVEQIKKHLAADEEMGFLQDLAEMKLGLNVTEEEATAILKMKGSIYELKTKWSPTKADTDLKANPTSKNAGWASEEARLAYGFALDNFKQTIGKMKLDADTLSPLEKIKLKNMGRNFIDLAGTTKAFVATLDNSFIGRQGIKTLWRGDYKIWFSTLANSMSNFGKELIAKSPGLFKGRDDAVMSAIRADIFSRPNAMNGKYNAAKNGYGLGVLHEEAFPTSFPERLPFIGRVFKASESAFAGSALRMRADLADAIIANAEQNGLDMLDEVQATAFGSLISSQTGRGGLGRLETVGRETNALFFSIKFLKSNIDTLTAHTFDKTMTPEAKRVAQKSLAKIAASITTVLTIAKIIDPDSVDFDPRKGRTGKIRIKGRDYDITGGMGGLVTFGSRLVPTRHNGVWGMWKYSQNTRKWTNLTDGGFGAQTGLDHVEQFFEGKLSPLAGAIRDVLKGQNFEGEKPTVINTTIGLITPISAEMLIEELQKGNDDILMAMMAEGFGISPQDITMRGYGTKWTELKEKVDSKRYNDALKEVTKQFNIKAERLEQSLIWKRLENSERSKELDAIRRKETEQVLRRYGIK